MSTPNSLFSATVTIPASQAVSNSLSLKGEFAILGLIIPATWTAASVAFQLSMEPHQMLPGDSAPSDFHDVYDETGNFVMASGDSGVIAGSAIMLAQNVYMVGKHFKLRSCDADGVSVNQAAARTITVIYRAF